jgi:hypothetical protein
MLKQTAKMHFKTRTYTFFSLNIFLQIVKKQKIERGKKPKAWTAHKPFVCVGWVDEIKLSSANQSHLDIYWKKNVLNLANV